MRSLVGRNRWLDSFMIHFSEKGPLWFFVVLGLLAWQGGSTERWAVLEALAAAVVTRGASELIGRAFFRERPFVREGFRPLIHHRPSFSFPSNHAACGFALAVPVLLHGIPLGSLLLGFALLLSCARVFVGVHYPRDVAAGALLGTLIACII
jgi:undecaprenyl-diphosphatase